VRKGLFSLGEGKGADFSVWFQKAWSERASEGKINERKERKGHSRKSAYTAPGRKKEPGIKKNDLD